MASGFPDTFAGVWMRVGKPIFVRTERGMTSGVGWFESTEYYFRPDGTLLKMLASHATGAHEKRTVHLFLFDAAGKLLRSSTRSVSTTCEGRQAQARGEQVASIQGACAIANVPAGRRAAVLPAAAPIEARALNQQVLAALITASATAAATF